jgi:FO synthase
MHAVSRLALHPYIQNIQVSWVKLGPKGAESCLNAGVNDMGGTLMNESISKAAGSIHGQEFKPKKMKVFLRNLGREPVLRDTLYNDIVNQKPLVRSDSGTVDEMQFFLNSAHPQP